MPVTEYPELIADVKEQILYLKELGVDSFAVDLPEAAASAKEDRPDREFETRPPFEKAPPPATLNIPKRGEATQKQTGSRLSVLPSLKTRTAVPVRNNRSEKQQNMPEKTAAKTADAVPVPIEASSEPKDAPETIQSIRAEIGDCTRCKLHTLGRTQIVHTTGNFQADLMFVGEAPGADEDEQGFPFVGRAGQLLTKIIEGIGLTREQVCIGNINRCRPPGNRQPEPDETAACRPFLLREIAVIKPKVIVVLGATAAHNLLQVKTPISKLRGNFQDYFGVRVMPTFHPAYLLRDPHKKREVWEDMKKVRDLLNGSAAK